jgi:hypothetical protein
MNIIYYLPIYVGYGDACDLCFTVDIKEVIDNVIEYLNKKGHIRIYLDKEVFSIDEIIEIKGNDYINKIVLEYRNIKNWDNLIQFIKKHHDSHYGVAWTLKLKKYKFDETNKTFTKIIAF